ncbi:MAG: hypothetical protein IJX58_04820 [Clostridia bacterium]|nr:hypothetical protein [Clostridia bacterium]
MKKSIFLLVLLFVFVLAFTACDKLHKHSWAEADCETPKTCSTCGKTEGEALGHTEEILPAKAATCTETGLTEGKKCSACGEILVAQEEIPASGHTEELVPGKANTCTESGLTAGKKCSVCDETLLAQEVIPAPGHNEEILSAKEATCTTNGLTEGKKCSACNEILVKQEVIPAAHKEEIIPGKAASCTEIGLTDGKKCSVCGETLLAQEEISSLGHKDGNNDFTCDACGADLCTDHVPADPIIENNVPATCQKPGSYDSVVKCSVCGDEISRESKIHEQLPHTEEVVPGKAATCTTTGLTEGKKCSVCGETLVAQEEIPVIAHTEEVVPGKAATCTTTGLTEGKKCSVCGETLVAQEEIPVIAHTEEAVPGKAATCTASGLKDGKKCSVCGETLLAQEVIPALGHQWGEGEKNLDVTTYRCDRCGVSKAESESLENNENIFTNKEFVGTPEALGQVLVAGWWAGGGYEVLTDGMMTEGEGRFSTLLNKTTAFMDGSLDLGEKYVLGTLRFYIYDTKEAITEVAKKESVGADILIQVYLDGQWYDIVNCANNADLCDHLVINEGLNNDYLEFDLSDIVAEKVRFYISASVSPNGITFQEIECNGALLVEHVHTEQILPAEAATCLTAGVTEGKVCSVCNEILVSQEVIPALGHDWSEGAVADGVTTYTCGNCGLEKMESDALEDVDNLFAGKKFKPTAEATASILSASWWNGSGYEGLTDGIKTADNAIGRFSTIMNLSGFMDSTIDFGKEVVLGSLKFYIYEVSAKTEAQIKSSIGKDMLIQVYSNGAWINVVICPDNEALYGHLVSVDGVNNDYLEFDLSGIVAEKLRFYISASSSSSGTTFQEVECNGKEFPSDEPVLIENVFTGKLFVPTEGDAAGNVYNVNTHGYDKLTDGITNQETKGRYSGKSAAGVLVEATLDLGGTYDLQEFTFYLYKTGLTGSFGSELIIQVLSPEGEWVTVVHCKTTEELQAHIVAKSDTDAGDRLVFDLGGVSATQIRFTMPTGTTTKYPSMHEITCSGYAK